MSCGVQQISGREMFEFNPELIEGDDDEADDVAYQREARDDVRRSLTHSLSFLSALSTNYSRLKHGQP